MYNSVHHMDKSVRMLYDSAPLLHSSGPASGPRGCNFAARRFMTIKYT